MLLNISKIESNILTNKRRLVNAIAYKIYYNLFYLKNLTNNLIYN